MSTLTNDELFEEIMGRVNHLDVRDDIEYRAYEITLASLAAESVSVNDDMAYAFHHALSDSSLGADEVEEIKTGLRAAFANVSFPVTADGWISCSERMPEDGQHVIILCDGAFVLYAQYRDGEFFDVVRNGEEFFETQSRNVTHWIPLPEPPQEVNRG
ncbi:DUF551 domain-containing protein [Escherichia coli]|uniref:DUF551 domain-containing protein n=1 Tax=Escherichia coli TaxID=562 RepID=UPI00333F693A